MAAGALLASAGAASASGIGVTEVTAEGLGRANSGEVADTGASALLWNPAAIARGPRGASVGAHYRNDETEFADRGTRITRPIPPAGLTLPVGGASPVDDVSQDFAAPNLALALPVGDRFALGLSVHTPFRLKTDFGAGSWARYDTIRSKIEVTEIQIAGAIQATDWLDLGFGVTANHTDAYYDQASPNLNPAAPDGLQALTGDGWNYGFTLGAQAHLERLTLGLAYRSKVKHELEGDITLSGLQAPLDGANFTAPADTNFTTRSTLTAGARFAVTEATTLNGQVTWSGWDVYDSIDVRFAGMTASIPQRFKNTTSVAVGVDHALGETLTVRGGVQYDPTPTRDSLREPGVFDSDRWIFAAGASAQLTPALTLNGALAYTRFDDANLADLDVFYAGTPAQTTVPTVGAFEGHAVSAAVSLDWRF
ncbi:MAG TPA: outer membrane protein transport protein [Phenylobacterium sp.]